MFVGDLEDPSPEPGDAHHLLRVLRLRAGDRVVASDGRGSWRWCLVSDDPVAGSVAGKGSVAGEGSAGVRGPLRVAGEARLEPPADPALTVGFAPVKGDRPEWVVEKLTELGVDRIVVLSTDRAVVRWRDDRAGRALARLEAAARQAAAQSRRVRLPILEGPWTLEELAANVPGGALCLAEPGGDAPSLRHHAVAVGPEGGWSDRELALDLPRMGLLPGVLRSETAAMAAGLTLSSLRAGTVVDAGSRAWPASGPAPCPRAGTTVPGGSRDHSVDR